MTVGTAFALGDRVYLSGPISSNVISPDVVDNLSVFHEVYGNFIKEYGVSVSIFNPATLNQQLDYDEMMRRCFATLSCYSHILMLPNWQHSKGACIELLIACQMKIKPRFLLMDRDTVVKELLDNTALKRTMCDTISEAITI